MERRARATASARKHIHLHGRSLALAAAALSLLASAVACGDGAGRRDQGGNVSSEGDTVATSSDILDDASTAPAPITLSPPAAADHGPFKTSQTCATCHSNASGASAMRAPDGAPIAPFDLWQATMMANAARDPLFRAVLSVELAATPSLSAAIQNKCLTCHSPMMTYTAHQAGEDAQLSTLYADSAPSRAALDGVSCTVCHQITPDNLGSPDSFSGHFQVNTQRLIYGPHAQPLTRPMENRSGYSPTFGAHTQSAALCGSCHTLFTDAHTPDGAPTGDRLPEQTPYLEWRNSTFSTEVSNPSPDAATCQACHMPALDPSGAPLSTAIARRPDGSDFPNIGARAPFAQHAFIGANALMLSILRDHAADLQPIASPAAFDRAIALTQDNLQRRTATLSIDDASDGPNGVQLTLSLSNLAGHKLPTAFPSRRVWVRLIARDAQGRVIFSTGDFNSAGQLIDASGAPLPSELAGGPILPHLARVTSSDQAQVYEAVMADADGLPTMRLLHGARYLKDNRVLPRGWRPEHPDAPHTLPVGTDGDPAFTDGAHTLRVFFSPADAPRPLSIDASLMYQTLSPRFAAELSRFDTPEVRSLRQYLDASPLPPITLSSASLSLP